MNNQRVYVHVILILAYAMWGTHGLWIRGIPVPATTLVFTDGVLGLLILTPLLLYTKQIKEIMDWRNLAVTVGVGLMMALTVIALYRAMQITTVSNAILAHWTTPVLVVLFGPLFLKERREKIFGLALAVAMGGLVLMMPLNDLSLGNHDVIGILVALLSAVFFCGSIIGTKKIADRFSPMVLMATVFIAQAIVTAPFIASDPATLGYIGEYLWLFLAKALITAVVPFFIYMWAIHRIEAQRVSILGYMEPLAGVAVAALFLSESPGWNTLIGGLLILAAGIWIIRSGAKREAREARESREGQFELAGIADET